MDKRCKVDLHTHSTISPDGGIIEGQYASLLEKEVLDCIAITDHNETKFAISMCKKFGEKIIVGEEISTLDGEIIGLFLKKTVPRDLTAIQTAKMIHEQGGLVYVPHPFEIFRQGIKHESLRTILPEIDIAEVFNARSRWRGKSREALEFAQKNHIAMSASSDAHCIMGMGSSYSIISEMPNNKSLINLLKIGTMHKRFAPLISYLCPAVNKIKHKFFYTE